MRAVLVGYRGMVPGMLLVVALPVQAQPPELQVEKPAAKPVVKSPDAGRRWPAKQPAFPERVARLPLIGSYRFATGFTAREVKLLRDGTYSLSSASDRLDYRDMTNEAGKSFGIWLVRLDGAVVLTPTDDTRKRRSLTAPLTLYPIRRGRRLYLLKGDEFTPFQKRVVAGYGRKTGRIVRDMPYLLRDGDRLKPVTGSPAFPARWRSFLPNVTPPAG